MIGENDARDNLPVDGAEHTVTSSDVREAGKGSRGHQLPA